MDSDDAPKPIKGVVIISLPPPDNPSLGKTITAFTLYSTPRTQSQTQTQSGQQQPHGDDNHQDPLPLQQHQPPANPQAQSSLSISRTSLGIPRKFLAFLGISMLALILYCSVSSQTQQELRRSDDDDRRPSSFLFPLYPKWGTQKRDLKLRLGKLVDVDKGDLIYPIEEGSGPRKIDNLVASKAQLDSAAILPVRGDVYPNGLYYTYMLVGSPPKRYFLDMDTGSDLTWIQCDAPCTSCAKGANALYKPRGGNVVPSEDYLCTEVQRNQDSGHCKSCKQCDYAIQYADQSSSSGVLARDELHLMMANGSWTSLNVVFGCAYDQQGLLLDTLAKTDGILGLSRAKVSLPSQLASKGIINNVVGHCLTPDAGGGYMFLGDDFVPHWGMAWAPMLNSPEIDYYRTEIVRMNYGSRILRLGVPDGQVVFDSGSSYTYFPQQAYSDLVASLNEASGFGLTEDKSDPTLPICWQAEFPIRSVLDIKHFFKTLTLQFGRKWWVVSTKLQIPPEGYLIISNKGNVCLGILDGSKLLEGSTFILGDVSLRGQLVIYDNVNQKIGWAPSDCLRSQRFKPLPFF
ncbi:hypothetical protein I3843_16G081200 [Carya illinoinensis]|nr:hypothetical protein I3760_16G085300 [Carya illinoinensis]KAG7942076.1 hypothetical protein I3843_16G081200 [Carya illinoinensis]